MYFIHRQFSEYNNLTLYFRFFKCRWSKQIKSGTFTETTPFHEKLLEQCVSVCRANAIESSAVEHDEDNDEEEEREPLEITKTTTLSWNEIAKEYKMLALEYLKVFAEKGQTTCRDIINQLSLTEMLLIVIIVIMTMIYSFSWPRQHSHYQMDELTNQIIILNTEMKAIRELLTDFTANQQTNSEELL